MRRLRDADDPVRGERPKHFRLRQTARRFSALVEGLDRAFACRCDAEAYPLVQDASFYGQVRIPASATAMGAEIHIRVSNFACLAVYGLEGLGAYSDAERDVLLDAADRDRVEDALTATGHVVLPEDVLWTDYDGTNDALREA